MSFHLNYTFSVLWLIVWYCQQEKNALLLGCPPPMSRWSCNHRWPTSFEASTAELPTFIFMSVFHFFRQKEEPLYHNRLDDSMGPRNATLRISFIFYSCVLSSLPYLQYRYTEIWTCHLVYTTTARRKLVECNNGKSLRSTNHFLDSNYHYYILLLFSLKLSHVSPLQPLHLPLAGVLTMTSTPVKPCLKFMQRFLKWISQINLLTKCQIGYQGMGERRGKYKNCLLSLSMAQNLCFDWITTSDT